MKRILTLLSAALCLAGAARAQAPVPCGFDAAHNARLAADPDYAQAVQAANAAWAWQQANAPQALVTNTPNGPQYEIPVVVHVIHTGQNVGTALNPSDATIQNWINYLNQTFKATYPSYPNTSNGGVAFPLTFVLAKRDTACNATTGIYRTNGNVLSGYQANGINLNNTTGADDEDVKALSRFPNDRYYNIWIVTEIDNNNGGSGTQGYAYFPGAGPLIDGTVVQASTVAVGNTTLPHEIGHAFSLYHTFEGDANGTTCPTNANCNTQGDRVCDTDPHIRTFGCPTGTNSCTGVSWVPVIYNIMGYSSCDNRFTTGQRTRFLSTFTPGTGLRASLAASLAGQPAGVSAAAACVPTITNPTNTFNAGPRAITFNTLSVNSSGYNGDGNKAYFDRSCFFGTEVQAGSSHTLSVLTQGGPHKVRAWIDWNNDGTFATTELVLSNDGTLNSQTHTATVAVPTTGVVFCAPLRMRIVGDRSAATSVTACGPLGWGQAEDYSVYVRGSAATLSIAISANPTCTGQPVTFTATPQTGTTPTSIVWLVNGTSTGATGTTYTTSTIANGAVVTAKMYYLGPCGADSAVSNAIVAQRTTTVAPTVSVAITAGSNPGCAGQSITFTASGTNTGTNPLYQWLVNGVPVSSVLGNTFTTSTLQAGDVVQAFLLSNSPCASPASATSAPITIQFATLTPAVTIAQTGGANPICAGKPATFTATPVNGGTAPTYVWFINGNGQPGATGATFTTTTLTSTDTVRVLMTSNSTCLGSVTTALSNGIGIPVLPTDTPTLSVVLTQGANPGCKDSLLTWTATSTKLGATPLVTWFVNGVPVATGGTFSSTSLQTGDVLTVRANATNAACRTTDTLFFPAINIVRDTTPAPPVISFIAGMLVSNVAPVQWYGPAGPIAGATSASYMPTDSGFYYARAVNGACPSRPSNRLRISLLDVADAGLAGGRVFPNPTSGALQVEWPVAVTGTLSLTNAVGQVLQHTPLKAATRADLDVSRLAAGVYYVMLRKADGSLSAAPITVVH